MDYIDVKNKLVKWIRDWFDNNGAGCNAVIGISGGKDSTVAAALCVEALDKNRVYGILMPNGEQIDIEDSVAVVDYLGIPFMQLNIEDAYIGIVNGIDNIYYCAEDGSRYGKFVNISEQTKINLAPRLRMASLYAVAQSINGRVVNTSNLSERWVGYSTRWGDNIGDLCPLVNLTSDDVVAIGDVLGLPHYLTHKTPSDGLSGKSDEDKLGFSYTTLNKYITTGVCEDAVAKEKIDNLHYKNIFKQHPIPSFKYEE